MSNCESRPKILFMVTGSIAAFKAAQVVSKLVQEGCEVHCMATESALKFVGEASFEGLTGAGVLTDLWESGRAMDHIHLSRWADLGLVCPATANTLAQLALGLAPDVVSATLLAWPAGKPLLVFPAMNTQMYNAAPTRENIARIESRGIIVAPTGDGALACGETGEGRMIEVEDILARVHAMLGNRRLKSRGRLLVTGGATREAIDGIRFISNHSTGRTAAGLCDEFTRSGWTVTYLAGEQAAVPRLPIARRLTFSNVESLENLLREELGREEYSGVVHCAAVGDFAVEFVNGNPPGSDKIPSGGRLQLELKPTRKILPRLREFSRRKAIRLVGFKLLNNSTEDELLAAAQTVLDSGADAVVANDWARVTAERALHPGFVLNSQGRQSFAGIPQMAAILNELLSLKEKSSHDSLS